MRKSIPSSLLLLSLLAACSSTPEYPPRKAVPAVRHETSTIHPGLRVAESMLGVPYRYGGSSPRRGFDCSGLVYYSFRQAGIRVPRTTHTQLRAANRVKMSKLTSGDLLFFRHGRRPALHVAIYKGQGRFIHAPSSGKRVAYGSMNDEYWKSRLIAAGRF